MRKSKSFSLCSTAHADLKVNNNSGVLVSMCGTIARVYEKPWKTTDLLVFCARENHFSYIKMAHNLNITNRSFH